MQLQDLFDELLLKRAVKVEVDKQQAETLRVTLSRKWSKYKKDMDACGFLGDDLAACSLGRRAPANLGEPYTFVLEPRKQVHFDYSVVSIESDSS